MRTIADRIRRNKLINYLEISFLEKIGDKKLICYGASIIWTDVMRIIAIDDLVEFFVDRDSSRWGEKYYGIEIKSPEELRDVDKSEYAVVVLAGAVEEIGAILDGMGWEKNVNYFNIYQYIHVYKEYSFSPINKYLSFLETVPAEIRNVRIKEGSQRIGILLNAEGLNFETTYIPYLVSLFLILKWRGHDVKLIVDRLHWDGDIELYEGRCAVCDYVRDVVLQKLKKLVSKDDILYVDPVCGTDLSDQDEKECERIAGYSARWSKWYNGWNSRNRAESVVQHDFAEIFKRNLSYINSFFAKNSFDTINAITALHKIAGIYYYAGRKRGIRVSSQDGVKGTTLISTDGPASYSGDIPRFIKTMWEEISDKGEILERAEQMWIDRRTAVSKLDGMSENDYYSKLKEAGYESMSFQGRERELERTYDVVIPMNLMSDGAALGVSTVFGDIKQWIEKTLDYVIHKLNGTVLIREHPSGKYMRSSMANMELYSMYPEILEPYKGNPALRYVKSDEEINLYQYIEQCKVLIPWTSTIGIEAALMRKNVLVHTDVYYRDAAFASAVCSQEEYFEKLKRSIVDGGFLVSDRQQAYEDAEKYFYYSMNRILITEFTIVNSNEMPWSFNSFDQLLNEEGVDEIVKIVAENIPSVYLIEKQRRRLGQL